MSEATHVSMTELLSNPAKFNNRKIVVEGVFSFHLSDSALFASEEWYQHGIAKEAVVLRLNPTTTEAEHLVSLSGKYVLVQGTFDSRDCGEMCLYGGAIKDVDVVNGMLKNY